MNHSTHLTASCFFPGLETYETFPKRSATLNPPRACVYTYINARGGDHSHSYPPLPHFHSASSLTTPEIIGAAMMKKE